MVRKNHDITDVDVVIHHETEPGKPNAGAFKVSTDGNAGYAVWVPKAAVQVGPYVIGKPVTISLPEAMAIEKGLV